MNHDEFDRRWKIGAAAVRSVLRADGECQAPPGFSGRIVAILAMWTEPAPPTLSPPIAESVGEQLPWFE